MKELHDATTREELKARIRRISSSSTRKWGKMTPDQMLWHCAQPLECAIGRKPYGQMMSMPLPGSWIRFMILNVPWIKGMTPTAPAFEAKGNYDLEAERARLLELIDLLAAKDIAGEAPTHPMFGSNSIAYQSKLQAKHLAYHLDQFGV